MAQPYRVPDLVAEGEERSASPVAKVVDGTPQVEAYEVSNSTFHKIASKN